jgi:thiamine-monophosphate kinase
LPLSAELRAQPEARRRECLLSGGDDYELVFTAPVERRAAVADAAAASATPVTRVGRIEAGAGLRFVDASGRAVPGPLASFDHFRADSAERAR